MEYCIQPGCLNKAQVRGLCRRHYDETRDIERSADRLPPRTGSPAQPSPSALAAAQMDYSGRLKSPVAAYLLWLFLGLLGVHRFYLGNVGIGLGMLFTLGGFGVWTLIDVFFIGGGIRAANNRARLDVFRKYGINV